MRCGMNAPIPINHHHGRTPEVLLQEVAAKYPKAGAILVLIQNPDQSVFCEWSNCTLKDMAWMAACLSKEMQIQLQNANTAVNR